MSGLNKIPIMKAQPQSIDAEESVLGIVLTKPETITQVKEYIPKVDIFYYDTSRIIWSKMLELNENHQEIDPISIMAKLSDSEKKKVTAFYVSGLFTNVVTTANLVNHAKIVLEKFLQRELINTTYKIQESAYNNTEKFDELIESMKKLGSRDMIMKLY